MGQKGWLVLVWVAGVFAVLAAVSAVWNLAVDQELGELVRSLFGTAFWALIVGGAWRRYQRA